MYTKLIVVYITLIGPVVGIRKFGAYTSVFIIGKYNPLLKAIYNGIPLYQLACFVVLF